MSFYIIVVVLVILSLMALASFLIYLYFSKNSDPELNTSAVATTTTTTTPVNVTSPVATTPPLNITSATPTTTSVIKSTLFKSIPSSNTLPKSTSSNNTLSKSTPPSNTTLSNTTSKSGYIWPAPDAKCWTTYPGHNPPGAIDVQAKMGSTVVAMVDGTVKIANNTCPVVSAGVNDACPPGIGCGNYVQLQHKDNPSVTSSYCHLSNPTVKVGDEVKAGQPIGISGSSGKASGPHLHVHLLGNKGDLALESIFADKKCTPSLRSVSDEWHHCAN
jgi:murein DD-endopeptidase MepM/ murein hydrolase activator NlpD